MNSTIKKSKIFKDLEELFHQIKNADSIIQVQTLKRRLKQLSEFSQFTKNNQTQQDINEIIYKCDKLLKQKLRICKIRLKNQMHNQTVNKKEILRKNKSAEAIFQIQPNEKNDHKINTLSSNFKALERQFLQEKSNISELLVKINRLNILNRDKDQEIQRLRTDLTFYKKKFNGLESTISKLENQKSNSVTKQNKIKSGPEDIILEKYQEKITSKKKIIEKLKMSIVQYESIIKKLNQKIMTQSVKYNQKIQEAHRQLKYVKDKLDLNKNQKQDLRKQIAQLKHKNLGYLEQLQKVLAQKQLMNISIQKNYSALKQALILKDKETDLLKSKFEPRLSHEKNQKISLCVKIEELEMENRKLMDINTKQQNQIKMLEWKLKDMQQKNRQTEHKLGEKKQKYTELKKNLEEMKSDIMASKIFERMHIQSEKVPQKPLKQVQTNKKLKALQNIRFMIKQFHK